ncbi:MAG: hypothetical protein GYB65_16815, partial [Chloroflexi bacterium]|nr:hypothetical protein [Chloroflexota bacterium]
MSTCKKLFVVLLVGMMAMAALPHPSATLPAAQPAHAQGPDADGSAPIRRTTAEIMTQQREVDVVPEARVAPLVTQPVTTTAPAITEAAAVPPPSLVGAPQTEGLEFISATRDDSAFIPPDTMGVVGPTQFLTHLNGRIRVHDKTTGAVGALDVSTFVFWSPLTTVNTRFWADPRVRYDRLTDRWILSMMEVAYTDPNRIAVAVSDGPVITAATVWQYFYFVPEATPGNIANPFVGNTCFADHPTLGVDANAVYIGVNMFSCDNPPYGISPFWVLRKSDLLNPATPANLSPVTGAIYGFFNPPIDFTPHGADSYDPNATVGYVVGNAMGSNLLTHMAVCRVNGPASGTPSIVCRDVPFASRISFPANIPGAGTPTPLGLESVGTRLYALHIRDGQIWGVVNTGTNSAGVANWTTDDRVGLRWFAINTTSATMAAEGMFYDSSTTGN